MIQFPVNNYYYTIYTSPVGELVLKGRDNYLTSVCFLKPATILEGTEKMLPVFHTAIEWLKMYFEGSNPGEIPPVQLNGTSFQLTVWQILRTIPYGHTTTYKAIAEKTALLTGKRQMSAQAVGNAVGHNPISIFIPCHRVVGSSGNLTGYAGGLNWKVKLLETEHIDMSHFYLPPDKSGKRREAG